MATINSKELIDAIIAHNGWHDDEDHDAPDNPRVSKIVEYTNSYGVVTWGVTFIGDGREDKYLLETVYVRSPKVIWDSKDHPL